MLPPHHAAAGAGPSSWSRSMIRTIDALKAFDTIFVITQGGPGTASETINIFLYLQAFAFYKHRLRLGRRVDLLHPDHRALAAAAATCGRSRSGTRDGAPRRSSSCSTASASGSRCSCWSRRRSSSSSGCCRSRSRTRSTTPPIRRSSSRPSRRWRNYVEVFEKNRFGLYLWNSSDRDRRRDADRAAGRRAGRLRHRARQGRRSSRS